MLNSLKTQKMYFEFNIVKWDESGNELIERHTMTVQRKCKYNAVTAVRKRYPISLGYSEELNDYYLK